MNDALMIFVNQVINYGYYARSKSTRLNSSH